MILIRQQRAAHVVLVKEVARGLAVVYPEHVAASETPANLTDPVARFQPRFSVLAIVQSNVLSCKIFGDSASRDRRQRVHELPIAEANEGFFQRSALH